MSRRITLNYESKKLRCLEDRDYLGTLVEQLESGVVSPVGPVEQEEDGFEPSTKRSNFFGASIHDPTITSTAKSESQHAAEIEISIPTADHQPTLRPTQQWSRSLPSSLESWKDWISYHAIRCLGSWWYIAAELSGAMGWIFYNTFAPSAYRFDPGPSYAALNLILSLLQEFVGSFEFMAQSMGARGEEAMVIHQRCITSQTRKIIDFMMAIIHQESIAHEDMVALITETTSILHEINNTEALKSLDTSSPTPRDSLPDRATDFISRYLRSWGYIFVLTSFFLPWTLINGLIPGAPDPYPFIYLNIAVSVWIATQEALIIKLIRRRTQKSFLAKREIYLKSVRELGVLNLALDWSRNHRQ